MAAGRLAVIPARGGSKRIPRKNVKPFAGRPMIARAIDLAQRSGLFAHVMVSTDDAEIAAAARRAGALVPGLRPAALADDFTGTVPVMAHAVQVCRQQGWLGDEETTPVCCLYPCVPLLQPDALATGLAWLEPGRYAFPVLRFASPVQRALLLDGEGRPRPLMPGHALTRTQDLPPAFHDAGQFYWGAAGTWAAGTPVHGQARCFELPAAQAVDIDTPQDWELAEALFALRERAAGRLAEPAT